MFWKKIGKKSRKSIAFSVSRAQLVWGLKRLLPLPNAFPLYLLDFWDKPTSLSRPKAAAAMWRKTQKALYFKNLKLPFDTLSKQDRKQTTSSHFTFFQNCLQMREMNQFSNPKVCRNQSLFRAWNMTKSVPKNCKRKLDVVDTKLLGPVCVQCGCLL